MQNDDRDKARKRYKETLESELKRLQDELDREGFSNYEERCLARIRGEVAKPNNEANLDKIAELLSEYYDVINTINGINNKLQMIQSLL